MKQDIVKIFENSTSDKENIHQYGFLYEMLLKSLHADKENQPLKVLELGVSRFGFDGSLKIWNEIDIVGEVIAFDQKIPEGEIPDKVQLFQGDAYSKEALDVAMEYSPYDLIIDDCNHAADNQRFVLEKYAPYLADGGALLIEDVYDHDFMLEIVKRKRTENIRLVDLWHMNATGQLITEHGNRLILFFNE